MHNFESSLTVEDRVVVRAETNRHAHGGFASAVNKEGRPDVTLLFGKEVAELIVVFIYECGFQLRICKHRD